MYNITVTSFFFFFLNASMALLRPSKHSKKNNFPSSCSLEKEYICQISRQITEIKGGCFMLRHLPLKQSPCWRVINVLCFCGRVCACVCVRAHLIVWKSIPPSVCAIRVKTVCVCTECVCVCVCVVAWRWWGLLAVPSGSPGSRVESGKPHLIKVEAAQCSTRTEHYWECRSGKPWASAHMLAEKPVSLSLSLSFSFHSFPLSLLIFHLVRDKKKEDKIDSVECGRQRLRQAERNQYW